MKIGVISHWYDPEGGAAAGPGTIARAISARGHEVHVVTGFPNYPTGKVFDGYRVKFYQRETMSGDVVVHRSPIYPSHDRKPLHRMANYASFAISGAAVASSVLRSCDAVLVYSSPATAALPAIVLGSFTNVPFVMQIQDLWPDTVANSGFIADREMSKRITRPLEQFCNLTYRRAHSIAVTSPGMATLLAERNVDPKKMLYVPNWADESNFTPRPLNPKLKADLGLSRRFVAMYAGNLGEMQDLDTIVAAARLLHGYNDIEIALVGAGVAEQRLRTLVENHRLENVTFIPAQPFSRMSDLLAVGDVQLVTLKNIPLYGATTPSKLQANLAAGRPIVASLAGDGKKIVLNANAGRVTTPGSPRALAEGIREMYSLSEHERAALGHNGRCYYMQNFSERVCGDRLTKMLVSAAEAVRP